MSDANVKSLRAIYAWARGRILSGEVIVTVQQACKLAAVHIYIEHGNYDIEGAKDFSVESYLPQCVKHIIDIKQKVLHQHKLQSLTSETDAMKVYMELFNGLGSVATPTKTRLTDAERRELGVRRVVVYVWTSTYLTSTGQGKGGHVSVEVTRNDEPGERSANTYISIWPKMHPVNCHTNGERPLFITDNENWSFVENYAADRFLEGRRPEYIFCFYTLNASNIVCICKEFMKKPKKSWGLLGQYYPKANNKNMNQVDAIETQTNQSCASLACLVLDAAGIGKLLSRTDVSKGHAEQQCSVSHQNTALMFEEYDSTMPLYNNTQMLGRGSIALCCNIMSPDVLLGRLKQAKANEWTRNKNVQQIGRMAFDTAIGQCVRFVSFSHQDPNLKLSETNGLIERTYEWLPIDEPFGIRFAVIPMGFFFVFLFFSLYPGMEQIWFFILFLRTCIVFVRKLSCN